jgi:putative hemolysin
MECSTVPDSIWLLPKVVGFVIAISAYALFSFLETSVTALRLFKLKEMARSTTRYTKLFETLENHPHQVLITILVVNMIANAIATVLITNIMEQIFAQLHLSSWLGLSIGITIATITQVLICEIIPKNMARSGGDRLFKSTLWITNLVFRVSYPVVTILSAISHLVLPWFGSSFEPTEAVTSEHEIRFLIDYINEKGLMEREKTEMLKSVFSLGQKQVKEIMVPEADIIMVNVYDSVNDALELFSRYHYSRLPAYEGQTDNIIGMVHQKDIFLLLSRGQHKSLKDLVRPILFVPETMKINQLLREFRQQGMHIAMVVNEHGSIIGLVTLEDVLEEIVGEIRDEHESISEKVVALEDGSWLADAGIDLVSLSQLLAVTFEVEDAVTLGGFLIEQLQRMPKKGERLLYQGYYFQIQKASHKRILQVLIFKQDKIAA